MCVCICTGCAPKLVGPFYFHIENVKSYVFEVVSLCMERFCVCSLKQLLNKQDQIEHRSGSN